MCTVICKTFSLISLTVFYLCFPPWMQDLANNFVPFEYRNIIIVKFFLQTWILNILKEGLLHFTSASFTATNSRDNDCLRGDKVEESGGPWSVEG